MTDAPLTKESKIEALKLLTEVGSSGYAQHVQDWIDGKVENAPWLQRYPQLVRVAQALALANVQIATLKAALENATNMIKTASRNYAALASPVPVGTVVVELGSWTALDPLDNDRTALNFYCDLAVAPHLKHGRSYEISVLIKPKAGQ